MLCVAIVLFAVFWIVGFIGAFRRTWVQKGAPWYGKLFAYTLMFVAWPLFVLLFMRDE